MPNLVFQYQNLKCEIPKKFANKIAFKGLYIINSITINNGLYFWH